MVDVCRPQLVDWDETEKGVAGGVNQGPFPRNGRVDKRSRRVCSLQRSEPARQKKGTRQEAF